MAAPFCCNATVLTRNGPPAGPGHARCSRSSGASQGGKDTDGEPHLGSLPRRRRRGDRQPWQHRQLRQHRDLLDGGLQLHDRAKLLVVREGPEISAASEPGHLEVRHSQFNGGRGNQGTQFAREE